MLVCVIKWWRLVTTHFVQILIKLLGFGLNASEIIPLFQEYTIWLPINIMGDELC